MGLPGHRRTSSHKRRRSAHFAIGKKNLTKCGHCNHTVLQHHVCKNCGYYKGKPVLKIKSKVRAGKAKKDKKEAKED